MTAAREAPCMKGAVADGATDTMPRTPDPVLEDFREYFQQYLQRYALARRTAGQGRPRHRPAAGPLTAGPRPGADRARAEPGAASPYRTVPFRQDTSFPAMYPATGERTYATGPPPAARTTPAVLAPPAAGTRNQERDTP